MMFGVESTDARKMIGTSPLLEFLIRKEQTQGYPLAPPRNFFSRHHWCRTRTQFFLSGRGTVIYIVTQMPHGTGFRPMPAPQAPPASRALSALSSSAVAELRVLSPVLRALLGSVHDLCFFHAASPR